MYQEVRHLDPDFLTRKARSRLAGSIRAPHRDRCARHGGKCSHPGPIPDGPLVQAGSYRFLQSAPWVTPPSSSRLGPPRRVPRASMSVPLTAEMLPGLPRSGEGQMPKEKSVPVLAVIRRSARRSDRPKQPRMSLRASVGSTEAAKDVVARVGRIDRSSREATSALGVFCTFVIPDP